MHDGNADLDARSDSPCAVQDSTGEVAGAFFEQVYRSYELAERSARGSIERTFRIAGSLVRLRFAGPALVESLSRAFAHLAVEDSPDAVLTVFIFDSESTGVYPPSPPWDLDDYMVGGEIKGFADDCVKAVFQADTGALSLMDRARHMAIYWRRSSGNVPDHEKSSPLRVIWQLWFHQFGLQLFHGGAVGFKNGGVLLGGRGGAGKSSTALACLQSDLRYASDDYCLVTAGPNPAVFSLYGTGKTHWEALQRMPFLAAMASNGNCPSAEKALFFVHEHYPERLIPGFPLRAILIPRVTEARATELRKASPAEALTALIPITVTTVPSMLESAFRIAAQVVRKLPCYYLDVGADSSRIPDTIMNLLKKMV